MQPEAIRPPPKRKEVADEMAASDPTFKKGWEHYSAFRETHKTWRTRGYLND